MKIRLNRLSILNFKGIRSMDIQFNHITNISGENATGKTTIFDAFLWLLFGKDSNDRKDFEIKPLDSNNQPMQRADHEISGFFTIDGEDIYLKHTYTENWVKKKNEVTPVFSGHIHGYFWNDVPLKLEEYQAKIAALVPESIFKLITNTGYFNNLKWQDRRRALLMIAGEITNDQIIDALTQTGRNAGPWGPGNKDSWVPVINALNAKKTEDEFKRELLARKKKIKDQLETLPTRINEAQRSLVDEIDYSELEVSLQLKREELASIEESLLDITSNQRKIQQEYIDKMKEMQGLQSSRTQLEYKVKNDIRDKRMQREQTIANLKRDYQSGTQTITRMDCSLLVDEGTIRQMDQAQQNLRERFKNVSAETIIFKEGEFHCPACKRAFEESDIDSKKTELTNNFNLDKTRRLGEIREKGIKLGQDKDLLFADIKRQIDNKNSEVKTIESLGEQIKTLEAEHSEILFRESLEAERILATTPEYSTITSKIQSLQDVLNTPPDQTSEFSSTLINRKRNLSLEIEEINKKLASKDQRAKTLARITELELEESELAGKLSTDEGIEFAIDQFIKAKMDTLEERINGRFRILKFKLFDTQINGVQVECCDALINGVPYSDANTASKINAGLDVINTLCEHYQVFAPVFVDNAESVNTLIPVNSQLIRLVVSKDKKLKIESPEPQMALAI